MIRVDESQDLFSATPYPAPPAPPPPHTHSAKPIGSSRPTGSARSLLPGPTNPNWKQQRARQLQLQVLGRGNFTRAADRKLTLSVSFTELVRLFLTLPPSVGAPALQAGLCLTCRGLATC